MRQPGCLPTQIPDETAVGLVQMSDAFGNVSWQPITSPDLAPSPALTGTPTAPTAAPGDASTQIATDAFVAAAIAYYLRIFAD